MNLDDLRAAVGELLSRGAAVRVVYPHGTTQTRPLARHFRIDTSGPDPVLWVRPLIGGHTAPDGHPEFPLNDCRPRGLRCEEVTTTQEGTRFDLRSGQTVHIEPADPEAQRILELWDTFTLTVLTAEEELALDQLIDDSWHGPHA